MYGVVSTPRGTTLSVPYRTGQTCTSPGTRFVIAYDQGSYHIPGIAPDFFMGKMRYPGTQRTSRAAELLCMTLEWGLHIVIHLSKAIQCAPPRGNPKVNYGLWVIMVYPGKFIHYNKRATLVGDVARGGAEGI